jgi:hypothetical protein
MAIIRNKPPEHSNAGKVLKILKVLRGLHNTNEPDLASARLLESLAHVAESLSGGEDEWFNRT